MPEWSGLGNYVGPPQAAVTPSPRSATVPEHICIHIYSQSGVQGPNLLTQSTQSQLRNHWRTAWPQARSIIPVICSPMED